MGPKASSAIEDIAIHVYDLTYAHGTYIMSRGREVSKLRSVVARVRTRGGLVGHAEVCPLGPAYLPGFTGGVLAALEELAPALIGVDATNLAEVNSTMDRSLCGHGYAKSVLDIACWDLLGRSADAPVSALLGGPVSLDFPLYLAVPLGSPGSMAEFVQKARAAGIHRFQLKIGGAPADDAKRVMAVLEVTKDEDTVAADANGGWRLQDATIAARLLDGFPRVLLEQPCPTIEECLALRRLTTLPMILDEVITDIHSLLRCQTAGAMDAINLKISRVGGITKARLIRDVAVELGLRLTIEDAWGGDLTTAAVSHLAASTPPDALYAASFMNDWTQEHIANHEPRARDGRGSSPVGPGLGIEVDLDHLGPQILHFTAG
jgi:L-alanine-DL-glutamate epimerase-like enolase superfamily enzyme